MSLRRIFAATCALALLAPAAAHAQAQGYWALSEAPDGIKLGLVFPDYSPNDFAGLGFACTPGVETTQGWSDIGAGVKGGGISVEIATDGARARYAAKVERSEMDDNRRAVFVTTLADPVFDDLAAAKTLKVSVGKTTRPLPLRGAAKAVAEFRAKCRPAGE